jgi:hypothetical protein
MQLNILHRKNFRAIIVIIIIFYFIILFIIYIRLFVKESSVRSTSFVLTVYFQRLYRRLSLLSGR